MTDNEFDALLKEALQKYALDYIDDSGIDTTPHEFSPEFEKKMQKLIVSMDKPKRSRCKITMKRIATVAACLLVVSSVTVMSVDALREKVLGFFIEDYGKDSIIKIDESNSALETIEDIYEITYDLSDYEIIYKDYDDVHRITTYRNGDSFVKFSQTVKENFNSFYNTEDAEMINTEINGCEAVYFKNNHGDDILIWNNTDYVFSIMTNLGYDHIFEIAYSVQVIQ